MVKTIYAYSEDYERKVERIDLVMGSGDAELVKLAYGIDMENDTIGDVFLKLISNVMSIPMETFAKKLADITKEELEDLEKEINENLFEFTR